MADAILMADDDDSSRRAVTEALTWAGYAATEADRGTEALAIARHRRPALVIAEVLLPGVSGYELCHAVKEWYGAELPVVLISERRTEPADRVAGLLLGADDYVLKPLQPAELIVRVRRLLGEPATDGCVSSRLTAREKDVMTLLTEGLSQVEIANRLVITPRTVAKHVEHILAKLDVHSRTQAVALALRERDLPNMVVGPADGRTHHVPVFGR